MAHGPWLRQSGSGPQVAAFDRSVTVGLRVNTMLFAINGEYLLFYGIVRLK